ncbi:hypothetical protein ACVIGB_003719 [Bradyrhizobium sp. USDA 4341]
MADRRHFSMLVLAPITAFAICSPALAVEEPALKFVDHPPEHGLLQPKIFTVFPSLPKLVYDVDRHLSLLITDVDIVKGIRLSAVMDKILETHRNAGGSPIETKEALFHQLWDTANQGPGLVEPVTTAHCDDVSKPNPQGMSTLNGYSYKCPRFEGDLALGYTGQYNRSNTSSPFSDDVLDQAFDDTNPYDGKKGSKNSYSAIAVSNRIDLLSPAEPAPHGKVQYKDCGEIRVIFARNSGVSVGQDDGTIILGDRFERNLIAFEARVPNPNPTPQQATGFPEGCTPLVQFFRSLSDPGLQNDVRGKLLSDLILKGDIEQYKKKKFVKVSELTRPVVDFRNFLQDKGQIRTDQFLNKLVTITTPPPPPQSIYDPPGTPTKTDVETPQDWTLREFRLAKRGANLIAIPDTVKSTVGRELLASSDPWANVDKTRLLIKDIVDQFDRLAGGTDKNGAYTNGSNVGLIAFPTLDRSLAGFESDTSFPDRGDIMGGYNGGLSKVRDFNTPISDALAGFNPKLQGGGTLLVPNVIDRMRTQTCAGCHQYSDTKMPSPTGEFGFDPRPDPKHPELRLGLGAVWPSKACGDVDKPNCALPKNVLDLSAGAGKPTKDTLTSNQHPPMQFTMISELILTQSVGGKVDNHIGWRYALSTTVECLLNAREDFFRDIQRIPRNSNPAPCAP